MNDLTSPPSRLYRAFAATMRWLTGLMVVLLVLAGLAWGALHFWIVPRIADFRPGLETLASRAVGVPVRVGDIVARSNGLVPSFELSEVRLLDPGGREALRLPRVLAAVSVRSLLRLDFEQLYLDRPELEVRRTKEGRILVAGLDFSRGEAQVDSPAADWFFSQREFVIRQGTLRWVDELRAVEPLALGQVDLVVRNRARRHDLRLDASPPAGWGERFHMAGQFRRPLLSTRAGHLADWGGQLYADLPRVDVSQLRRYLSTDVDISEGQGAVRAWVDVLRGEVTGGVADLALPQVTATLGPGLAPLALQGLQGRLGGQRLAGGFRVFTEGLQFSTREGLRWPGGNIDLSHTQAEGRTPAAGELRADRLDLAALSQIAHRLPLGTTTHAALQAHPVEGVVQTLQARWQGPLSDLQRYEARGRIVGLAFASRPAVSTAKAGTDTLPPLGTPGLRGASVDFDLNQTGGKGKLTLRQGALEFPGVFEDPVLLFDRLAAEGQWRIEGDRITVPQLTVQFANADVEGELKGSWRTGDPATAASRSRFPGILDLQGVLPRADGARVHRYLPQSIPADVRHYVRDAVQQGRLSQVAVRIRGDLFNVPYADARQGEFRFAGKLQDALYAYVPPSIQPRGQAPWPALHGLSGELVFDRASMQVKGGAARMGGPRGLPIARVDAQIADLMNTTTVVVTADARGPLADMLAVVNGSPLSNLMGKALDKATATGDAGLRLRLNLPIMTIENSKVQGSVTLAGNDLQIAPDVPRLGRARGLVTFSEKDFAVIGGQARMLGGDARIEGGSRPANGSAAPVEIRVQGVATAEGLRAAGELGAVARLASNASGAASYTAVLGVRRGQTEVAINSNLQGLALNLPAPLVKSAESALPLRVENALLRESLQPAAGGRLQDQWQVELGRQASVTYVRDVSGAAPRVLRGSIAVGLGAGESAPMPADGVVANISVPNLDVDAWESLLSRAAGVPVTGVEGAPGTATGAGAVNGYLPTSLAVRAGELKVRGHRFSNVVVGGTREGSTWRANVDAQQLNGYLEYRQPDGAGAGRVYARLSRLNLPQTAAREVETLLDEQLTAIPALDIVVEDFELRGKRLGRVEVEAVNRSSPVREWRLNKLNLSVPEATLSASGNWATLGAQAAAAGARPIANGERRRTAMNFRLDLSDAGALLTRLGMKDVIRRGRGRLEGQVAWAGSPLSPDYPSLSGQINANVESGQFLKADPGLAKLLGVLSLQSLPRRLALDFRDVFSEGFAFDFIRGDATIVQGVATTNNLQMKGVNAAVLMDGRADIAKETQDLRVIVVPEINAGTASLIASAINPAIGLGSFLAQMFLRRPLIQAATQEFHIDGTWADPRVTKVDLKPAPAEPRSGATP